MSVFFRVEFKCDSCGADILYEDEIPVIHKDRNAIVNNNKANKWLKQYDAAEPKIRKQLWKLKPNNVTDLGILILSSTRYHECPVCNERIYLV